ncbi:MAG: metal ABC transporter ATP-binding protein [Actinobacteria bacterium]|nr:metal ABC transporter ATP-binding protein [Actinomycetota bacterium]MBW3647986.1 metal ABC transporter ATP-binding protein [Actinomycetota bacterium]
MSPPGPLVTVTGVSFGYDRTPVLLDIDYTVEPGEFTGIVGPSGSGKTSLLKLLLGTVRPQRGQIQRQPGLAVSYVPQLETVNWSFPVTVAECVLMSRSTRRLVPWATAAEKADVTAVLERLGIAELAGRHIRELSGGQQQRMFIARALLRRPRLLLMDEPTSGVDIGTRHEVLHLLDDLNREGLAIVLTTHDLNGMAAHLPHLVALQRRIIAAGAPREVIVPEVLEQTFGARMDVLQHLGMPVVVDSGEPAQLRPVAG